MSTTDAPNLVPYESPLAREALQYGIAGLVLSLAVGFILGPIAIKKGLDARKLIAENPEMGGEKKARIAIALGVAALAIDVLFIFGRVLWGVTHER